MTGCCAIGAAELDPRSRDAVLPDLPQGARGALAEGFDGVPFDKSVDDGRRTWHEMGVRLRRAYKPVRV